MADDGYVNTWMRDGSIMAPNVVPIDEKVLVWRAVRVRCRHCGACCDGVAHADADFDRLACPQCHVRASVVVWEVREEADGWTRRSIAVAAP
jgi:phage FluMu protein Com